MNLLNKGRNYNMKGNANKTKQLLNPLIYVETAVQNTDTNYQKSLRHIKKQRELDRKINKNIEKRTLTSILTKQKEHYFVITSHITSICTNIPTNATK